MKNTYFISEFNKRKRDKLWKKDEVLMKESFRFKLTLLKVIDGMGDDVPKNYLKGEFYRLSLGYRGIGKNGGFVSGIQSKDSHGINSNLTTNDHVVGATEVGKYIHEEFIKKDYDIEHMVDYWLYEHLFLWATIKLIKEEHHKDNVIRNEHKIEEKLSLKHYINVSDLI